MDGQIIVDGKRRRNWPVELKRQIVAESYDPDISVCDVAGRHGVDPAQIYQWRRALRAQEPRFVPVDVSYPEVPAHLDHRGSAARIELVLSNGRRLFVPLDVDPHQLARLVKALDL